MLDTKRLKAAMLLAGVAAKDLGEAEGWSKTTLYKRLNGETDWSVSEIMLCKELLNMSGALMSEIFFAPEI